MLFSIIIPCYNRSTLIYKTIQTFIQQEYTQFEILIVDDGGTDNTAEVIAGFNDERLKYYKKEKAGVSAARNFGIEKSNGDILNFFDSDDLAYPNHILEAYRYFTHHPNAEMALFDFDFGDPERNRVQEVLMRYKNPNLAILEKNYPAINSFFIKKSALGHLRFNENLSIAEDWDLWLKLSVRYTFNQTNIKTSYIVDHQERTVRQFDLKKFLLQKTNLIQSLKNDTMFYKQHKEALKKIDSHMSSYISIHALADNQKKIGLKYFLLSLKLNPLSIFSKRTLAIVKHLIF